MSRMQYFVDRLGKMDKKAMWETTGLLKKRSGKSRAWLMKDMLNCAGIRGLFSRIRCDEPDKRRMTGAMMTQY